MENRFIRVRSSKDVVISSICIILGIILLIMPASASVNIFGFFLLSAGIIFSVVLKSGYKDVETGIKYCKSERYFSHEMHEEIKKKIASPGKINTQEEDKGTSLRLDVYYNKSAGTVYAQLYEYVPYTYEPCSEVYEHPYETGSKLIEK